MKIKVPTADGGIKTLLAHHAEKFVFGIVVFLSLLLFISGYRSREVVKAEQTPEDLRAKAAAVRSKIETESTWEGHYKEQRDLPQRYLERVDGLSQPVEVNDYALRQYMRPPFVPPRTLRKDPVLLAAVQLRAIAGHGVLAVKPDQAGMTADAIDPSQLVTNPGQSRTAPDSFISADTQSAAGRGVYFVAVTALVPQKKQLQLYLDVLGNSDEFDAERDSPKYLGFSLERAEVPADGSTPTEWVRVGSTAKMQMLKNAWAGTVNPTQPFVASEFTHPTLTSELPPIKGVGGIAEWTKFATHPGLPSANPEALTEQPTPPAPRQFVPESPFRIPAPGSNGEQPSSVHGPGRSGDTGSGSQSELGTPLSERAQLLEKTKEYLLIRYFDMDVEPGKKYQYRVTLGLEDPNNPASATKPPIRSLEPEVAERVSSRDAPVYRMTPPSDPSPVVVVESGHKVLAGNVTVPEGQIMRGSTESFLPPGSEVTARVIGVEFDARSAAEKAIVLDVRRGAVLNGESSVEVLLPLSGNSGKLEGATATTNTVVVDFEGGAPIGATQLVEPGRVLVWKPDGTFAVARELDDAADFAEYGFMSEEEETTPAEPPARERPENPRKSGNILDGF